MKIHFDDSLCLDAMYVVLVLALALSSYFAAASNLSPSVMFPTSDLAIHSALTKLMYICLTFHPTNLLLVEVAEVFLLCPCVLDVLLDSLADDAHRAAGLFAVLCVV